MFLFYLHYYESNLHPTNSDQISKCLLLCCHLQLHLHVCPHPGFVSMSVLTATAKGPASAVEKQHAPPQMTFSSSWRLIHTNRDAGTSDVAHFHPRNDPSAGLWLGRVVYHVVEFVGGLSERSDVVVQAQPFLKGGLGTNTERGGSINNSKPNSKPAIYTQTRWPLCGLKIKFYISLYKKTKNQQLF